MKKDEITARLADFIERADISHIPDSVIQKAKLLVTDFLGVAAGGSIEESSKIIQELTRDQKVSGAVTLIGTSFRSHSTWAAFANGNSGHTLDYDDVSQPMYGHPTTAVLPASLAVGESLEVSGSKLLESYIIGLEVAVKLAYGMNPKHYEHGWHSTCTLGTIGATAAAGKLMGLKGDKLRAALAIGASQAGGLQQNFGTMTKPFHAGRAAQNGVLAALLAQKGWTGDQNILEAPLGFFHLFCGPGNYDAERCVNALGAPYDIDQPGIILKKYPSCAFSHPAIDAALAITQTTDYDPKEVERVEGYIHGLADQILIHHNPRTGLEAKFSMEACVSLALLDGNVNSKSFVDDKITGKDVSELVRRVRRIVTSGDQDGPKEFGPATVKAFLKGDRLREATVQKAKGNPENPMSLQEIQDKYRDCCSEVLPEQSLERSLSLLEDLDKLDQINELMDCFRVPETRR